MSWKSNHNWITVCVHWRRFSFFSINSNLQRKFLKPMLGHRAIFSEHLVPWKKNLWRRQPKNNNLSSGKIFHWIWVGCSNFLSLCRVFLTTWRRQQVARKTTLFPVAMYCILLQPSRMFQERVIIPKRIFYHTTQRLPFSWSPTRMNYLSVEWVLNLVEHRPHRLRCLLLALLTHGSQWKEQ